MNSKYAKPESAIDNTKYFIGPNACDYNDQETILIFYFALLAQSPLRITPCEKAALEGIFQYGAWFRIELGESMDIIHLSSPDAITELICRLGEYNASQPFRSRPWLIRYLGSSLLGTGLGDCIIELVNPRGYYGFTSGGWQHLIMNAARAVGVDYCGGERVHFNGNLERLGNLIEIIDYENTGEIYCRVVEFDNSCCCQDTCANANGSEMCSIGSFAQ